MPVRAPGALPLLGHAVPMLRDPRGFLNSLPGYGDLVEIRMGPLPVTMVTSPHLSHQVMLDDKTFDKGGPIYDRGREVLGNGVVTCPYADHRRLRRLAQPLFAPRRFDGHARLMSEQIAVVTAGWRPGAEIDVVREIMTITGRTAVATLFSQVLTSPILFDVLHDFQVLMAGIYPRSLTPAPLDRIPTPGKRRFDRAMARLQSTVAEIIADYRRVGVDHNDLLSILLAGRDGDALTEKEITDAVLTFFLAATDTTALAAAWALHHLAMDPDLEQAVQREVDSVLHGRAPQLDDLDALEITDAVVTEALRMYPPVWLLTRKLTTDAVLGGHSLRKDSYLAISPYVVQHRADLYPDPERFDPSRWYGSRSMRVHRQVRPELIPFGAGARKCMGDVFAMTESALILATVIGGWQLVNDDPTAVRPALSALLPPQGLRLRVEPRQGSAR